MVSFNLETGFDYFGARYYSSPLGVWLSVDPLAGKNPSMSPYNYCAGNPVMLVDPDGMDVEVTKNEKGTYTVTGGTINKDKNIYIMKDGKRTGEILGETLTEHSFFNEENQIVSGAEINPNDNSGQKFLDNLKSKNIGLASYISNATNGEKYDFKASGTKPDGMTNDQYTNRGMPLKDANGNTTYGTARDVGNYGAGYVSGRNGLTWEAIRFGFDAYQSYKDGSFGQSRWSSESMT